MKLFVVARANKYFKTGTWLRLFDEGEFQEIEIKPNPQGHNVIPGECKGILYPASLLAPFVYPVAPGGEGTARRRAIVDERRSW